MKYSYEIKVNFDTTNIFETSIKENLYYDSQHYDTLFISNSGILLFCKRNNKKKDLESAITNFNSTFNTQINKAIAYIAVTKGILPKINSLEITLNSAMPESKKFQTINQPFLNKIPDEYLWDSRKAKELFNFTPSSKAVILSTIYWIKGTSSLQEGEKFDKLWKSFNTLYTFISQKDTEFNKLKYMREYIWNRKHLFPESLSFLDNINKTDIRKLRIREMILNDYPKTADTKNYANFIIRYTDSRLNEIFNETLAYRNDYLNQNNLYSDVINSISTNINQNKQYNEQLLTFYLIKYAYFIRNKYFHAEKSDSTFHLIANAEVKELSFINKLLSIFLKELIDSNL